MTMRCLRLLIFIQLLFFSSLTVQKAYAARVIFASFAFGMIYSDSLDGGDRVELIEDISYPQSIAVDRSVTPNQIYISSNHSTITRYNSDGTNPVDIITGQSGIDDIELDVTNRIVYWVKDSYNDDQLYKADMDGLNSNISSIYATTTTGRNLWGLALDVANNRLWITERGSTCYNSRLRTMTLSGAIPSTLISVICNPHDIEYYNNHIYYLTRDGLVRADTDGTNEVTIVESADSGMSLAIDSQNSRLFWTSYGINTVSRIDMDGLNLTDISTASSIHGIDIGTNVIGPLLGDFNNNGVQDLEDVILGLQVLAGETPSGMTTTGRIGTDGKVSFDEILNILGLLAE